MPLTPTQGKVNGTRGTTTVTVRVPVNVKLNTLVAANVTFESDLDFLRLFLDSAAGQPPTELAHVVYVGLSCPQDEMAQRAETLFRAEINARGWKMKIFRRTNLTNFEIYKRLMRSDPVLKTEDSWICLARHIDLMGPALTPYVDSIIITKNTNGELLDLFVVQTEGNLCGTDHNDSAAEVSRQRVARTGYGDFEDGATVSLRSSFFRGDLLKKFFAWATPRLLCLADVWIHLFAFVHKYFPDDSAIVSYSGLLGNLPTYAWTYLHRIGSTGLSVPVLPFVGETRDLDALRQTELPKEVLFQLESVLQARLAFDRNLGEVVDEIFIVLKIGSSDLAARRLWVETYLVRYAGAYLACLEKEMPAEYSGMSFKFVREAQKLC